MSKINDFDAIQEYYEGKRGIEDLTEAQFNHKTRLLKIWTMQAEGKPNSYIIRVMKDDYGISRESVYRDMRAALKIYSYVSKAEKEGLRGIYRNMATELYHKALVSGDLKAANSAMKNLIAIDNIDKESPEIPNFADKEVPLIVTTVAPELEAYARQMLAGGVVDLNKPINLDAYAEDAEIVTEDAEH